jgi:3-keto-5-aminohexanoate cleavage enzyme
MEKLIITNCAADSRKHEGVPKRLQTPDAVAKEIRDSYDAGAVIAHIHGIPMKLESWEPLTNAVREVCPEAIIQFGIAAMGLKGREKIIHNKPDMASIALGSHDFAFIDADLLVEHTRQEIEDQVRLFNDNGVKAEFECFNLGHLWNLEWLLDKGIVEPPLVITIFFGWPGGFWSPATLKELLHRIEHLPSGCRFSVSAAGLTQTALETVSIIQGGHVRVGTEDEPYYSEGVLAEDNAQLVARIGRISRELGREIATVDEARTLLGLPSVG